MRPFFVYALGDFLVLFVPVLRQIARYLPPHRTKMTQKPISNQHTINSKQLLTVRFSGSRPASGRRVRGG